jgi:hypothetical protein
MSARLYGIIPENSKIKVITPQSRLLERLLVSVPVKKYPAFNGTHKFITVFTRAHPPLTMSLS